VPGLIVVGFLQSLIVAGYVPGLIIGCVPGLIIRGVQSCFLFLILQYLLGNGNQNPT
jgi:hypothetical protein